MIEVVSNNWRDGYFTKLGQYEAVAIPEYWIVDYAALGGRRFLGNPKQPTISVHSLVEGEYQVIPFHFKVDTFRQAGGAGEAGEAGGARKVICINNFVKWYQQVLWK